MHIDASQYETGHGIARKVARALGEDRYQTFLDYAHKHAQPSKKRAILHDLDPMKVVKLAVEFGVVVNLK